VAPLTWPEGTTVTFAAEARGAQSAWKTSTSILPGEAKAPGQFRGKTYPFCLPRDYAVLNLLPGAQGALATFAKAQIPWHLGVGDGPTNHLCSSQVQCVNALAPFVDRPDALRALFGGVLDIASVVPFGDPTAPDDHVAFEWIGENDPLGEWKDSVGSRGANCTSADAAIRYVAADGAEEIALIEWKYTEQYLGKGELSTKTTSQATRDQRYRHLYENSDGPILHGIVPYEDFFVEPVYQLFRLSLLAAQLEAAGAAARVRVVYCAPARNVGLWKSLNRASHRAACGVDATLADLWRKLQRRPDRFHVLDTTTFVTAGAPTSDEFKARYGHIAGTPEVV
jgi:hypothetical protein